MKSFFVAQTIYFRLLHMVVFFLCFCAQAQETFTKTQILSDMAYLKNTLEEAHYNLYAYTPKKEFDRNYEKVKQSVRKDSFNLLEATTLLQRIISKANNGHTEIGFPGQSYGTYAYAGGTIFPLEIAFEDGKALVVFIGFFHDIHMVESPIVCSELVYQIRKFAGLCRGRSRSQEYQPNRNSLQKFIHGAKFNWFISKLPGTHGHKGRHRQ